MIKYTTKAENVVKLVAMIPLGGCQMRCNHSSDNCREIFLYLHLDNRLEKLDLLEVFSQFLQADASPQT